MVTKHGMGTQLNSTHHIFTHFYYIIATMLSKILTPDLKKHFFNAYFEAVHLTAYKMSATIRFR